MIRGIRPRQLLGAVPAIALFATDDGIPGLALVAGVVLLTIVIAIVRVLAWQRHTYEFLGGRIVERSGIISRSERALEIERIQQVDVDRTLLDRLVGTCEVRLETAADSGDSELTLRVVSVEEARRLRRLLAQRVGAAVAPGGRAPSTPTSPGRPGGALLEDDIGVPEDTAEDRAGEEVLVSVPLQHVALAAVTGPRLLAVPAFAAVIFGTIVEYAAPDEIVDTAESAVSGLSVLGGVLLFVALVIGSILIAAITGIVRDGGFTIGLRGSDLLVRRGLTTTRSATVPLRRVQRVTVRRRWLQHLLGYASVTVHSAGSGGGDGTSLDRSLTVPLLPDDQVDALVHRLLDVEAIPPLRPHPPAARRRAVVRSVLGAAGPMVPVTAVAVVLGRPTLLLLALPLLVLGIATGLLAYRQLASGADEHAVAERTGALGATTEISPLRKTQGASVTSSW
jgi:putative membrane protein